MTSSIKGANMQLTDDQRAAIESGIAALKQCGWTHRVPDLMAMLDSAAPAQSDYQYAQPGSPDFDGAEAYQQHLEEQSESQEFVFPPMPPAVVMHEKVGPLFDRLSMQFYASKCMSLSAPAQSSEHVGVEQAARVGVMAFHLRRVVMTYEAGEKAKVPLSTVIEGIRDWLTEDGWKRNAVSLTAARPASGETE